MNREELVAKMQVLSKEVSNIRKDIDMIDFNSKIDHYNSYIGKYFRKEDKYMDVCCVYCSSVDTERRQIVALHVSYYTDSEQHFHIQNEDYFDPLNEYTDNDIWVEIDKSEFYKHYNHVQSIIKKKLGIDG